MARLLQVRQSAALAFVAVVLIVGGVFGLAASSWAGHSVLGATHEIPVYIAQTGRSANEPTHNPMGFAPLFKPALPAVVSITSSRIVKVPQSPFFNDPFFQQFFGGQTPHSPQEQRERGLGSGVIISPDGYILTNNHVIEKGTDIKVTLADKRQFPGKVIGADPQTDIAVVKIATTGLPTIPLGDSSKLEVGDYAFAIGNPFGVGETATMGIISATGRNGLSIEDYEDFIQTDAAINPGNSGGALLNAKGELVGINTAILSGGGGNQGIGFAIPINMAKYVMDQILKHGKVVRGYIGVGIQDVTPELARVFHVPAEKGALVSSVEANTPGGKAGLERGDVITEIDGQPVESANDLRLKVGTLSPGTTVHLKVDRNGQTRDFSFALGEAPNGKGAANNASGAAENDTMRGVQVDELTDDVRQQLGLKPNVKGVVVTGVSDDSPAADAGLQRGDVIVQVNRQPVDSVSDYQRLVSEAGKQTVVLLVNHGGNTIFLVVQPE
ncbi:MAG TPA: DegQ family serine endoprotease [Candidatus Aquilonibacter sp.]|nr:DegQ family serine endoprotease [Candidatus Aquilonibacter sp.]